MTGATSCGDTRIFGAEVDLFPDRPPMIRKNAFKDPNELYNHSPDEMDNATIDNIIASNELLRELEPDALIAGYTPSPFLLASILRGLEYAMMDAFSENGFINELMEFCEKSITIMNKRICASNACDCTLIPGAYDNVDLLGLESFRKICIPSLRRMYELSSSNNLPCIMHPHACLTSGNGIEALKEFMEIGFECVYYGEDNDHGIICDLTDDRCATMGGIDTFTSIFMGPDERVIKDTSEVLEQTKGRRHIFTCSCSVDASVDISRIKLMIDTVNRS